MEMKPRRGGRPAKDRSITITLRVLDLGWAARLVNVLELGVFKAHTLKKMVKETNK